VRIGQLSEQSGVKVETIRYYERVGLLPAPPRAACGYREYRADHVQRLVFLRHSRELGFSIREVQELLRLASQPSRICRDVRGLAAARLVSVRMKIRELRRLQRALEKLVQSCPREVPIAECGILEALTDGTKPRPPEAANPPVSSPRRARMRISRPH
jgi:Hg(II)-responsive transcriptional regulator